MIPAPGWTSDGCVNYIWFELGSLEFGRVREEDARRPVNRIQVIDPYKMYSISAEFGSLHRTHLLVLLRARELLVNSPEQNWLISGSLGSFALTGNARGPVPASSVQGPRPNIIY